MTATNMCSNFGGFRYSPPPPPHLIVPWIHDTHLVGVKFSVALKQGNMAAVLGTSVFQGTILTLNC